MLLNLNYVKLLFKPTITNSPMEKEGIIFYIFSGGRPRNHIVNAMIPIFFTVLLKLLNRVDNQESTSLLHSKSKCSFILPFSLRLPRCLLHACTKNFSDLV